MITSTPSYFLVDDHGLLLEGLKNYLAVNLPDWKLQGHALSVNEAQEKIKMTKPSVVFVDHQIGNSTGLELIKLNLSDIPASSYILVSQLESKTTLKEYMRIGVVGFVSKKDHLDEIKLAMLHTSNSNELYLSPTFKEMLQSVNAADLLTPREVSVIQLIAKGLTNKDAGKELSCSEFTIKTHKANIMRKLNVNNSVEICNWALKNNLL